MHQEHLELETPVQLAIPAGSFLVDPEAGKEFFASPSLRKLFFTAVVAQRDGNHGQAIQLFELVLTEAPNHVPTLRLLGVLLLCELEFERAVVHLQRSVELDPEVDDGRVYLGHSLSSLERHEEALQQYQVVYARNPEYPRIHFFLGRELIRTGNTDLGGRHMVEATRREPGNPAIPYKAGWMMLQEGQVDAGIAFIDCALTLDPTLLGRVMFDWTPLQEELQRQRVEPVVFADGDSPPPAGPPVAFSCYSFPKCGTHLLSDVMMEITGQNYYWPQDFPSNGVPGDVLQRVPENHFLIGHWHPAEEFNAALLAAGQRAIVQYRDPRDQIVSYYFNYTQVEAGTGNPWTEMLEERSKEDGINLLIAGGIKAEDGWVWPGLPHNLYTWMEQWRSIGIPVLFVSFEQMVDHKVETIARLADFVGRPLTRSRCAAIAEATGFKKESRTMKGNNAPNDFKRKGVSGDWRNHFTECNKALFKKITGDMLIRLGLETDDRW
ncbi:MAG: sulfotransferase domain-containing protein [Magnetococcales bacterium]|nr:sulfotransferase domain-containing protein [Magnetococcales bacterium]